MTIIWRMVEDGLGWLEGSCISEKKYSRINWFDKILFEPVSSKEGMIEHKDEEYCMENGLECLLFYTEQELNIFMQKAYDTRVD